MQDRERKASETIRDLGENAREAAGRSTVPPERLRTSENTSSSSLGRYERLIGVRPRRGAGAFDRGPDRAINVAFAAAIRDDG